MTYFTLLQVVLAPSEAPSSAQSCDPVFPMLFIWTKSGRLGEGQTVATYEWGSSGLANKRSLNAVAEVQTYTLEERTLPFTSSFAVGAQDNPIPTSPPLTVTVPAMAFTCDTMSFQAADESVVPAFGKAPQVAEAKEIPHQTKAADVKIQSQIWTPREKFFTNPFIRRQVSNCSNSRIRRHSDTWSWNSRSPPTSPRRSLLAVPRISASLPFNGNSRSTFRPRRRTGRCKSTRSRV